MNDNQKTRALGISRVADNEQCLLLSFNSRPEDAHLRAIHDIAAAVVGWDPHTFEKWADEPDGFDITTGAPGIGAFANALQMWAINQRRPVSVAAAAVIFNFEIHRVIEAVEWHPYMLLSGPHDDYTRLMIEHDGE